jgi:hypothetical protein
LATEIFNVKSSFLCRRGNNYIASSWSILSAGLDISNSFSSGDNSTGSKVVILARNRLSGFGQFLS